MEGVGRSSSPHRDARRCGPGATQRAGWPTARPRQPARLPATRPRLQPRSARRRPTHERPAGVAECREETRSGAASDAFDGHAPGMGCQRIEVVWIGRQHRSARLGTGHDQRVYGRASPGSAPEECRASCQRFSNRFKNVADLQKPIRHGVTSRVTPQALDKHHGWHHGRPDALSPQRIDQGGCFSGAHRQAAHGAGVEHQHPVSPGLATASPDDSAGDSAGTSAFRRGGLSNLRHQLADVPFPLPEKVQTAQLGPHSLLQELRCRQPARFHRVVQFVRQIHLHPRHTPIYTHFTRPVNRMACPCLAPAGPGTSRASGGRREPVAGRLDIAICHGYICHGYFNGRTCGVRKCAVPALMSTNFSRRRA